MTLLSVRVNRTIWSLDTANDGEQIPLNFPGNERKVRIFQTIGLLGKDFNFCH